MMNNQDGSPQTPLIGAKPLAPRFIVDLSLAEFNMWTDSYYLTGLVQLAKERAITLRVMSGHDLRNCLTMQEGSYQVLILKCADAHRNNSRVICFDSRDQSDAWQKKALLGCDFYFKRSTYLPDTEQLAKPQQSKVRPMNPMFATWCSGAGGWNARLVGALVSRAGRQVAARQSSRQAVSSLLGNLRIFAYLSTLDNYQDTPAGNKRKQVLFQTRLWDPSEEKGDWVEDCNRHRVEMVRTLRRRLGERCVGGLTRTPYTEEHYPELLSNLTLTAKAKRPEFIRLCRQFLVRVNIKALFECTPFSLGETLAANNCLISETIRNSFATPLIEGEHYAGFTTPDECADRCLELLDSDDKAARLREAGHAYYRGAVCPKEVTAVRFNLD